MSDVYAERGHGNRTLGFGAKIGVVVVDFQRGFIDGRAADGGAGSTKHRSRD
jgi:maleamate amidohydrolase